MGQPDISDDVIRLKRRRTRGTETSQYPEEEKTKVIAQVVASERATAQTSCVATRVRGCRTVDSIIYKVSGSVWKVTPQRVKVPYAKLLKMIRRHLSKPEHVKFWPNLRGPSRKAKYSRETDSEPVP